MTNQQPRSFTTTAQGGLLRTLTNECHLTRAFDRTSGEQQPVLMPFTAIWDTGATGCVITQAVIDAYSLVPSGVTRVRGAYGAENLAETFLVDIYLPNVVRVAAVKVHKGDFIGGDVLIGMKYHR